MRIMERFSARMAELDVFECGAPAQLLPHIRQPLLGRLLRDWQARCANGLLPARRDFTPEQLGYILGNLILWDIQGDPPVATYRLYGSNFAIHRIGEMTGKRLDQLPDPAMRSMAMHGLQKVIAERQPLLTRGRYARPGDTVVAIETLTLPLAGDGHRIDMILHGQFNEFRGYEARLAASGNFVMQCEPVELLQTYLRDPRLGRLLQDWVRWRGRHDLPSRSDFNIEALDYLAGRLVLCDIVPPTPGGMPRFRYSLFGSDIAETRGFDLTGKHIDEYPDSIFAARAQLACVQATDRRLPLRIKADAPATSRKHSRFEALVLPLAADHETPDTLLVGQISMES